MVSKQFTADMHALRGDLAAACEEGGATQARCQQWRTVVEYLIGELDVPQCEQCGQPMRYERRLQAYTCDHAED